MPDDDKDNDDDDDATGDVADDDGEGDDGPSSSSSPSSFRAQLLQGIAGAVEDFAHEKLLAVAAAAVRDAADAVDSPYELLQELTNGLARCDLLARHEKAGAAAAEAASSSTTTSTPLSRRLLDATRAAWRRLPRGQALWLGLLLARAADAALDPFAVSQEFVATRSWQQGVAAVGAVVGCFGCASDVVRLVNRD